MIILIYGTDTFRSREKLQEVKKQFKEKHDASGMNIVELDGARASLEEVSRAVTSSPFLSSKRLIVLKNLLTGDYDVDNAVSSIRRALDGNTILVFEEKPKKDVKKLLAAKPEVVYEFDPMEGAELLQWIRQRGKSKGLSFVGRSVAKLIDLTRLAEDGKPKRAGANTWRLATEINKLANLGRAEITEDDVLGVVSGDLEANVFQFIDALSAKEREASLALLHREFDGGNDAGRIFHLVVRQIRILLQVKKLTSGEEGKLGFPPFVIERARKQAALWQNEALRVAHERLLEMDKNTKSTTISPETLLVQLVGTITTSKIYSSSAVEKHKF